jgi:hypothetical protein
VRQSPGAFDLGRCGTPPSEKPGRMPVSPAGWKPAPPGLRHPTSGIWYRASGPGESGGSPPHSKTLRVTAQDRVRIRPVQAKRASMGLPRPSRVT